MSVIDFRPHTLRRLIITPGEEDADGDWHPGTESLSEPLRCHAVAAGRAAEITFPDGTTAAYRYTVGRLPPDCAEFRIGDRVMLRIGDSECEYSVKGFHRYQLPSKIWV